MSRISARSHRVGLALALPCLLLAVGFGAVATWETRPLPPCGGGVGFALKCRRIAAPSGWDEQRILDLLPTTRQVEFGGISGVPDLAASGVAVLVALLLYLGSRGLGWILAGRARHLAR